MKFKANTASFALAAVIGLAGFLGEDQADLIPEEYHSYQVGDCTVNLDSYCQTGSSNIAFNSSSNNKNYDRLAELARVMVDESEDTDPEIAKVLSDVLWEIM